MSIHRSMNIFRVHSLGHTVCCQPFAGYLSRSFYTSHTHTLRTVCSASHHTAHLTTLTVDARCTSTVRSGNTSSAHTICTGHTALCNCLSSHSCGPACRRLLTIRCSGGYATHTGIRTRSAVTCTSGSTLTITIRASSTDTIGTSSSRSSNTVRSSRRRTVLSSSTIAIRTFRSNANSPSTDHTYARFAASSNGAVSCSTGLSGFSATQITTANTGISGCGCRTFIHGRSRRQRIRLHQMHTQFFLRLVDRLTAHLFRRQIAALNLCFSRSTVCNKRTTGYRSGTLILLLFCRCYATIRICGTGTGRPISGSNRCMLFTVAAIYTGNHRTADTSKRCSCSYFTQGSASRRSGRFHTGIHRTGNRTAAASTISTTASISGGGGRHRSRSRWCITRNQKLIHNTGGHFPQRIDNKKPHLQCKNSKSNHGDGGK